MIKKIRNSVVIFLSIFFLSSMDVYAENIDTTKVGSINVVYSYADRYFSDANIYLYKIADIDLEGHFNYVGEFINCTEKLNGLTSSEWNDVSILLNKYIDDNKIEFLNKGKTDLQGKFLFSDLSLGLYLVKIDPVSYEDYKYSSLPSLISIPNYNEIKNYYMYDIDVILKTEAEFTGNNFIENNNTTNSPNTFDAIVIYVVVFIVSLLCIIGVVCYIYYRKKKGDIENEKDI